MIGMRDVNLAVWVQRIGRIVMLPAVGTAGIAYV